MSDEMAEALDRLKRAFGDFAGFDSGDAIESLAARLGDAISDEEIDEAFEHLRIFNDSYVKRMTLAATIVRALQVLAEIAGRLA